MDNIVVLRTLSKAYALAGLRFGIALANKEVIQIMRNVLAPYPIAAPSIEIIKKSLSTLGLKYYSDKIFETIEQREYMINELKKSKLFAKVFETKTNFLFAVANDADKIYTTLKSRGIICKRKESDLKNSIRITLGNKNDNLAVLDALGIKQKFDNTRIASVTRITKETKIYIEAKLDKKGVAKIDTGIGFFDHMLDQIVKHSGISMNIQVIGDTNVDPHHTIEDTGIAIGEVIKKALGNKKGIRRYTNLELVMDEA
ncbi:hypothetical protein FACS189459_3460 [Bacilli bacterium]|nr:hypothetical protein FACS189459_3460 [Bacilli bacterium]